MDLDTTIGGRTGRTLPGRRVCFAKAARLCLLLFALAGCAAAAPDGPAAFADGALPHGLTFGVAALWSAAIKPVKEPVSTLHRVAMVGLDFAGGMIVAPFKAVASLRAGSPAPQPNDGNDAGMDLAAWEETLDELTGTRQTRGTVRFLIDGDVFFPALYDAIAQARRSIDMRVYIFDTDDVALDVADRLKRRSREARVRVLMDGIGSAWAAGARPDTLPRGHRAPISIANYLRQGSRVKVRLPSSPLLAGDHVKTIVVDDERAFLGGMNIGREYRYEWHDMMVELRGPVVAAIQSDFDASWNRASPFGDLATLFGLMRPKRAAGSGGGAPLRLLATRPGSDQIRRARLAAFERARRYIFVETPYLGDRDVAAALAAAARRGVDVRLILPEENDSALMAERNRDAARLLMAAGARVFIYPGFTHAKAMLVDGWAMFGSSNMDWFSHVLNRELDVATADPGIVDRLKQTLFRPDFGRARELGSREPSQAVDLNFPLAPELLYSDS